MAISVTEKTDDKIIEVKVSGTLVHADYADFVPRVEKQIKERGKVRVLFDMADFHGWNVSALWDELKFDVKHFADVERFAMVGDRKWEKALSMLSHPFTMGQVRYFERTQIEAARAWLAEA
ncbi:MAG TPA: STAS/SEC14 domain-containing protein [Opitutus sp.]|nr:STAS/SEC14 domain-containing protein [Opitutus sp.]